MFDLSWGELLLIGVVALVVIGPKELPGVLRSVGQWVSKIRRMAADFQSQFQDAMREAELADLRKPLDDLNSTVKDYNPFSAVQSDLEKSIGNIAPPVDAASSGTGPVAPPPEQIAQVEVPALKPPAPPTEQDFAASPPAAEQPAAAADADKRP